MVSTRSGASIGARVHSPSVHLAPLVGSLADAIAFDPSDPRRDNSPGHYPLLRFYPEQNVIRINTSAVLSRMSQSRNFRQINPRHGGNFFPDVELPRYERAWIGGAIPSGTDAQLSRETQRLVMAVEQEIDRLCREHRLDLSQFEVGDLEQELLRIQRRLNISFDLFNSETQVQSIQMAESASTTSGRRQDLARLLTSTETIHGSRESFLPAIQQSLRSSLEYDGDYDDEEIDDCLDTLANLASQPQSQLNEFFDFLEQEALSRVRLAVSFRLMSAIAREFSDENPSGEQEALLRYVQRAEAFWRLFHDSDYSLHVALSHQIPGCDFQLRDEVQKGRLYKCLPVWSEWNSQLLEEHDQINGQPCTHRELSYRFKINGNNPEFNMSAFLARLQKIRRRLLPEDESQRPEAVNHNLSELLLLDALIGDEPIPDDVEAHIRSRLEQRITQLQSDGDSALTDLFESLTQREVEVNRIRTALLRALRCRDTRLPAMLDEDRLTYHILVNRDLVDADALLSGSEQPFRVQLQPGASRHELFQFVRVVEGAPRNALFSVRVDMHLSEYSLRTLGEPTTRSVQRLLPERAIQVLWKRYRIRGGQLEPGLGCVEDWRFSRCIIVEYADHYLQHERADDEIRHRLAAYRAAFTILVQVVLEQLTHNISRTLHRSRQAPNPRALAVSEGVVPYQTAAQLHRPYILMLRMQGETRSQNRRGRCEMTATEFVYSASHAIERAIGRNFHCKLQGLVYQGSAQHMRYKERNALAALCSAFPVRVGLTRDSKIERVGVITLTARPCDVTPGTTTPQDEGYVLLTKSYIAEAVDSSTLRLSIERMDSAVGTGCELEEQPPLVVEAVQRLAAQGCSHILYLAHRFGDRRTGRSRSRQRFHDNPAFLEQLHHSVPDVVVYPLVRDVFPATRLHRVHQRANDPRAYEIIGPENHQLNDHDAAMRGCFVPVYTIATLKVVGGESDKPQSGFSTYFLINDPSGAANAWRQRPASNLILPESPCRNALLAVLRGIHFLECEKMPLQHTAEAVLDPYQWMHASSTDAYGEFCVLASRRRSGSVVLSLPAVLDRMTRITQGQGGWHA